MVSTNYCAFFRLPPITLSQHPDLWALQLTVYENLCYICSKCCFAKWRILHICSERRKLTEIIAPALVPLFSKGRLASRYKVRQYLGGAFRWGGCFAKTATDLARFDE
jgi:hypothetical protein